MLTPRKYYNLDLNKIVKSENKYSNNIFLLPSDISSSEDVQQIFTDVKINHDQRLFVIYYNQLWEPLLKIASIVGLRNINQEENWLDSRDIKNMLSLTDFQIIGTYRSFLFPIYIPFISYFINKHIAWLPIINRLCLTTVIKSRKLTAKRKDYSVSIIIPSKNEEGNIPKIVRSIPKFGKSQEIIFVEGGSTDNTWKKILAEKVKYIRKNTSIKALKQRGKGKANAVSLGFKNSRSEILMIYDADMTVPAKDLLKFYDVLALDKGEFAFGSRMVYPMEQDAMRLLNKIGNKLFSILFTWILGQKFKDTLCGTKAFFRRDFNKFKKFKHDPFGDFELIFGAIRSSLKVVEIPVRYKKRVYGSTNISRFKNGIQLLKMTWYALLEFKIK